MKQTAKKQIVSGPSGLPITIADLPAATDNTRMTAKRKAMIVLAVEAKVISETAAKALYKLTHDEWQEWRRQFRKGGIAAMRATKMQEYR